MNRYQLTYARCVVLTKVFETQGDPDMEAIGMEDKGQLPFGVEAMHEHLDEVDHVVDEENIWEVEEIGDDNGHGSDEYERKNGCCACGNLGHSCANHESWAHDRRLEGMEVE